MGGPLLDIRDLCTELDAESGPLRLVDRLSLRLERGRSLGLVGESGCGKTMTALSVLRLLPPGARVASGQVHFDGRDLLTLADAELRALRGDRIGMVFQEPLTALNPVLPVGDQVAEVLRAHGRGRGEARRETLALLERVGVVPAAERFAAFPHQLSGGLRQRVLVAIAVACKPDLVIADEPTTALDLTLQAQVLELLLELKRTSGMALLLISHDLGVVAETCDSLAVLYAGRIVEEGSTEAVFQRPRHPYTAALLAAARALRGAPGERLPELPGMVAAPSRGARGCRFAARCARADQACGEEPALDGEPVHRARCRHPLDPEPRP